MIDPFVWLGGVAQHLPKWLDVGMKAGGEKRAQLIAALKQARNAVADTKAYIKSVTGEISTKGIQIDKDKEADLSAKWKDVAVDIRLFDKNFAKVCDMKGNYWQNPSDWSIDKVRSAGIALEQVEQRIDELLKKLG